MATIKISSKVEEAAWAELEEMAEESRRSVPAKPPMELVGERDPGKAATY